MRRILSEDSGATAIEYAVIAGLLALGIVGSLVTTKGSLKGVFGTASSQMSSSTSSTPASPRAPFWQAKTIVSGPTTVVTPSENRQATTIRYSDGTVVSLSQTIDANGKKTGPYSFNVTEYANNFFYGGSFDSTGTMTTFQTDTYKDLTQPNWIRTGESLAQIRDGQPYNQINYFYNTSGAQTSFNQQAPTDVFLGQFRDAMNDGAYFSSLAP